MEVVKQLKHFNEQLALQKAEEPNRLAAAAGYIIEAFANTTAETLKDKGVDTQHIHKYARPDFAFLESKSPYYGIMDVTSDNHPYHIFEKFSDEEAPNIPYIADSLYKALDLTADGSMKKKRTLGRAVGQDERKSQRQRPRPWI